jgi:hypothetical protein
MEFDRSFFGIWTCDNISNSSRGFQDIENGKFKGVSVENQSFNAVISIKYMYYFLILAKNNL